MKKLLVIILILFGTFLFAQSKYETIQVECYLMTDNDVTIRLDPDESNFINLGISRENFTIEGHPYEIINYETKEGETGVFLIITGKSYNAGDLVLLLFEKDTRGGMIQYVNANICFFFYMP